MTETAGTRPEHDPLAEDLDLLTVKEAAARLYDQLIATRERIAELERGPAEPGQLEEARDHERELRDAIERASKPATPAW
jgi:hypothetical protein